MEGGDRFSLRQRSTEHRRASVCAYERVGLDSIVGLARRVDRYVGSRVLGGHDLLARLAVSPGATHVARSPRSLCCPRSTTSRLLAVRGPWNCSPRDDRCKLVHRRQTVPRAHGSARHVVTHPRDAVDRSSHDVPLQMALFNCTPRRNGALLSPQWPLPGCCGCSWRRFTNRWSKFGCWHRRLSRCGAPRGSHLLLGAPSQRPAPMELGTRPCAC